MQFKLTIIIKIIEINNDIAKKKRKVEKTENDFMLEQIYMVS